MRMGERRASEFMNLCDKGHVLLAALMLIFLLGIAGMTSLYLAGQDGPGVSAMKEDNVAQQLADGAADVVMSWFHDPSRHAAIGCWIARQASRRSYEWAVVFRRSRALAVCRDRRPSRHHARCGEPGGQSDAK